MSVNELPRDLQYKVARLFMEGVHAFEGEQCAEMGMVLDDRQRVDSNKLWLKSEEIATMINAEAEKRGINHIITHMDIRTFMLPSNRGNIFLEFKPPIREQYENLVSAHSNWPQEQISVVDVVDRNSRLVTEEVGAVAGTDVVFQLIQNLAAQGRHEVHLGIGAGGTSYFVCRSLAKCLRSESAAVLAEKGLKLVVHAISPGFDAERPLEAPSAKFTLFERSLIPTEYIGLFAEPFVPTTRWNQLMSGDYKEAPGLEVPFNHKDEIDIVISSLASRSSRRGLWNRFAKKFPEAIEQLKEQGWIGDFQFCPFSRKGPITDDFGFRAVTLFQLDELFAMAKDPKKHVVLVAGPGKEAALRYVLRAKQLRFWDYAVIDVTTAIKLVEKWKPRAHRNKPGGN